MKVKLIAPFFGAPVPYLDLWLRSCGENPTIEWLMPTDADLSGYRVPSNVEVAPTTLAELRARVSSQLGFEVALDAPYKLIDYRPAYGEIFESELTGYDVWGHCDHDVIFGDLKKFFPDSVLSGHGRCQKVGHLAFFRNEARVNHAFRTPLPNLDYRLVMTSNQVYAFDEWAGMNQIDYLAHIDTFLTREYLDCDVFRFGLHAHAVEAPYQLFFWEDGRVFCETASHKMAPTAQISERQEYAYIHLQKRRMATPDPALLDARGFYITPDAFVQKTKDLSCFGDFERYNPDKYFYRLKSRLGRVLRRAKSSAEGFAKRLA